MQQNTIFVFDLDGVITNPEDSSVDRVTVEHIYKLLEDNKYVSINTGRSYAWVKANLLDALRAMDGHTLFDHLYIVCEKGGESLIWHDGDFHLQSSRFALSEEAMEICKRIFDDNASDLSTMFWDATKLTMATIEKRPEASLEQFRQQQTMLVAKLKEAFTANDVRIDGTTIATDVELSGAGKHAGAELIYEWLARQTGVQKTAFICFGDSKSDYEMARYFAAQGNKTTFVFVGKKDDAFDEHDNVELIKTRAMYSAGTREYFSQLSA
jgi:HAD superfamily hydrolase (TIGR01484 family)